MLRRLRSPALATLALPFMIACSAAPEAPAGGVGGSGASAGPGGTGGSGGAGGPTGGSGGYDPIDTSTGGSGVGGGNTGGSGGGPPCVTGAGGGSAGATEVCGNGIDDNINGFIDEGCSCTPDTTQPCYPGQGGLCTCEIGQQTCVISGEFGQWGPCTGAVVTCAGALDPTCEICGNGTDDDCDGAVDEECVIDLEVDIDGDCVTASCPPQAPYPIGCNIVMSGGDNRGCVASTPGSPVVYFQEGDACGAGHVGGTLKCSSQQGAPLSEANCPINKPTKYYPTSPAGCPDT